MDEKCEHNGIRCGAGETVTITFAKKGAYLLTLVNAANVTSLYLIETGDQVSLLHVNQLVGNDTYFKLTPTSKNQLTITATNAVAYVSSLLLGATSTIPY